MKSFAFISCLLVLGSLIGQSTEDHQPSDFLDEIGEGESDFISIEDELRDKPQIVAKQSDLNTREKRQSDYEDYSNYDDGDYTDENEGSGDGAFYDSDDSLDDDDGDSNFDVVPSRVVPSLVSPSFEAPGFGNIMTRGPNPSKTAFDVIKTSLYGSPYEEVEEGSGNEAYDGRSTISPTKVTGVVTPRATRLPEFSPTFPVPGSRDDTSTRDSTIVTDRLPIPIVNQPPYIQKKLRKYAVTAGRSLR